MPGPDSEKATEVREGRHQDSIRLPCFSFSYNDDDDNDARAIAMIQSDYSSDTDRESQDGTQNAETELATQTVPQIEIFLRPSELAVNYQHSSTSC